MSSTQISISFASGLRHFCFDSYTLPFGVCSNADPRVEIDRPTPAS